MVREREKKKTTQRIPCSLYMPLYIVISTRRFILFLLLIFFFFTYWRLFPSRLIACSSSYFLALFPWLALAPEWLWVCAFVSGQSSITWTMLPCVCVCRACVWLRVCVPVREFSVHFLSLFHRFICVCVCVRCVCHCVSAWFALEDVASLWKRKASPSCLSISCPPLCPIVI